MDYYDKNKENGFTLVELLIAMTIGLIILAALSSTFLMQRKAYDVQEQIVEMVQNSRAAMDIMSREIRMAGYDPTGLAGSKIVSTTSNSINFTLDITDDAGTGPPDGDTSDANENITYSLYTTNSIQKLGRKSTATAPNNQPVAENIEDLQISQLPQPGNSIRVVLIARTSKPDPDYTDPIYGDHYRRYTITSVITPRNLNL